MIPLEPDKTYHIFNRVNGNEIIFANDDNYSFFLKKYIEHIAPVADTFCYCLLPNHFHFLLRIKPETELKKLFEPFPKLKTLEKVEEQTLENKISKRFSNFFSSYSQAFNKQKGRKGSLFMKNFKRKVVIEQEYLLKLVTTSITILLRQEWAKSHPAGDTRLIIQLFRQVKQCC